MKRTPNLIPPPVRPKIMNFKQFLMHQIVKDALTKAEKAKAPVSPPAPARKSDR